MMATQNVIYSSVVYVAAADTTQEDPPEAHGGAIPKSLNSRLLPPCRVCGQIASGLHYGVNTCYGCKGFFRRSLERTTQYKCTKNDRCNIGPGQRNLCCYCRFQKCLAVGMSKEGIKIGRYTHEKRAQDIQEVKYLQREKSMKEAECQRKKELEALIDEVRKSKEKNVPGKLIRFLMVLPRLRARFQESLRVREQTFGQMKTVSPEEFQDVYERTGLQVDDRVAILNALIPLMEKGTALMIQFFRDLSRFRNLPVEDQRALFKAGFFEVWLVARHKVFDCQSRLFTTLSGVTFEIDKLFGEAVGSSITRWAGRMQSFNLSQTEAALIMTVILFSPDRCRLTVAREVEEYQTKLLEATQYFLLKNHPKEPFLIGKVISCISDLRTITDEFHRQTQPTILWEHIPIQYRELLQENT